MRTKSPSSLQLKEGKGLEEIEEIKVFNDSNKVFTNIILGITIIVGSWFLPFWKILRIPLFFVGGSFLFFAFKSMSRKPQIIANEKGLYLGGKIEKKIPWKRIIKITGGAKSIDMRNAYFLEVFTTVKKGQGQNRLDLNIENVNYKNKSDLIFELNELLEYYKS